MRGRSMPGTSQALKKCSSSALLSSFSPTTGEVSRTGSCPHQPAHDGQTWTPEPVGRAAEKILDQDMGLREVHPCSPDI